MLKTRSAGGSKSTMYHSRASRRYLLREKVIFSCKHADAIFASAIGFTENVSTTGIAFLTEAAVEVASRIALDLHLRPATGKGNTILLHADGSVLRVEPVGNQNRIAAEIRFLDNFEESFTVSNTIQ
jgi:hypothetical protein